MSFLTHLSIRNKVIAAFTAILFFTISLGAFSITRVALMHRAAIGLENNVISIGPLGLMSKDARQMVAVAAISADQSDPDVGMQIFAQIDAINADYEKQWALYKPQITAGREAGDATRLNAAFTKLYASAVKMQQAYAVNKTSDVTDLLNGEVREELHDFTLAMDDDLALNAAQAAAFATTADHAATSSTLLISIILGVMVLGTLIVGILLVRAVSVPIGHMTSAMRRLAGHEIDIEIPGIGRGDEIGAMAAAVQVFKENAQERVKLEAAAAEFQKDLDRKLKEMETAFALSGQDQKTVVDGLAGSLAALAKGDLTVRFHQEVASAYQLLKTDFNNAVAHLQEAMQGIAANTQGVHAGAGEITQASDDLARRTEQQAASLEETAAALDVITATVRTTAQGATDAREVVTLAKQDAERSGEVVREAVAAMTGIETSSRQISNIIGVIDEIAFQTNLLALNAGVEAARAGDAGRGFAVVATEVRALAQRSAEAAKEIKSLISASGKQVDTGVKLVAETGKSLARIVEQVNRLNALVANIAGSAQEQATGLAEVNAAVSQMDQVTQQNAAMVEEATAASHGLAGEADALAGLVGQFQLGGKVAPARRPQNPRPAGRFMPPARQKSPALQLATGTDDGMEEF